METKPNRSYWLIAAFFWSIFMGITFFSIGLGSLFTSLNLIAAPFVCPGGQMQVTSTHYQVSPTESGDTLQWYCVNGESGEQTELNPFIISLYSGPVYGLLIFALVLMGWYFNSRYDASKATEQQKKWGSWIVGGLIIVFVVGITLFNLMPSFRPSTADVAPLSISHPAATATALAQTYRSLTLGKVITFTATGQPLTDWNDIPIMPQATAGVKVGDDRYMFRVPVDTGTIGTFYTSRLEELDWKLVNSQMLGLWFSKGKSTLLVVLGPESDLKGFVVTLILAR